MRKNPPLTPIIFPDLKYHFQDERRSPEVFFTSLIFHFMLATYSNNHSISASVPGQFEKRKYALAIFCRVVSLLNHSCNPNTGIGGFHLHLF